MASISPKISVIVPVHNVAQFLPRCIESLISQTIFDDMEVILVENGSNDTTWEICKNYETKYHNIKALTSDKTGPSEARNYGLLHTTGELIGFIDGDDYVNPHMFEKLTQAQHKFNADITSCNFILVHQDGSEEHCFQDTGEITIIEPSEYSKNIILDLDSSSACILIFKKAFFESHKFPEKRFYEDHASIYKWVTDCNTIVKIDTPLYYYCLRDGSTTTSAKNTKFKKDLFRAQIERLTFAENYCGWTDKDRKKIRNYIIKCCIRALKSYVYAMKNNPEEYNTLMSLREQFLKICRYNINAIDVETWLRIWRIKHMWNRYYNHIISH